MFSVSGEAFGENVRPLGPLRNRTDPSSMLGLKVEEEEMMMNDNKQR